MALLSGEEWQIVALSLRVSGVAITAALPVAFGIAWLLARAHFPGKILLDALVHLPLVLPPTVLGFYLLIAMGPKSSLGSGFEAVFGSQLVFSFTGIVIASMLHSLPYAVQPLKDGSL